jgi:hypothetical protein
MSDSIAIQPIQYQIYVASVSFLTDTAEAFEKSFHEFPANNDPGNALDKQLNTNTKEEKAHHPGCAISAVQTENFNILILCSGNKKQVRQC